MKLIVEVSNNVAYAFIESELQFKVVHRNAVSDDHALLGEDCRLDMHNGRRFIFDIVPVRRKKPAKRLVKAKR